MANVVLFAPFLIFMSSSSAKPFEDGPKAPGEDSSPDVPLEETTHDREKLPAANDAFFANGPTGQNLSGDEDLAEDEDLGGGLPETPMSPEQARKLVKAFAGIFKDLE